MAMREGAQMAERLRRSISALKVEADGKHIQLTVSIGIATWRTGMESQEELLVEVDKALYAAKAAGRNCVAAVVEGQVRLLKGS
jgi:diguanylate cyclase (GGDEF)-like protein